MKMPEPRDVSLAQLIYFTRCAEYSSMADAAAALYVAPSAISNSIANLEKRLGTPLFIRRRAKGLMLTSAGQAFLARTRQILFDLDDAISAVDPDQLTGDLRVGIFPTLAPFYLPEIAERLASQFPGIAPQFVELSAGELEPALRDNVVEVALTYDLGLGPGIHRERLKQAPLYAAFSADHPLAQRERVYIFELAEEPMVLLDWQYTREYFTQIFANRGLVPNIRHRFSSFETVRAMVARSRMFTLLNQRPAHDLTYDGGRLVAVEVDEDSGLAIVLASAQPITSLTRRPRAFVDACRSIVGASMTGSHPDYENVTA
ncbi:LysR substrate-binding domain-containing protein [Microbacterium sp. zg.B48]|uniref:LysR substrate-binding domain-containing protein n=1 Tax=unclassified Microbacterium TaxID=2609290 RepID=UPI00214C9B87|nr:MULTISPECIES: LysR substrate-binding domain-containing protein [unclassified Microbacterium]MCR2764260.1 LysR substrate-binding domain-containing protein [Microbacterium sp. zg.B48]MCR2810527.1 LysR substrate-binding domain-containing protein [Microbacterium sp. zg.B185]WIM19513.1 LysR substrate-binding domain-containing protein [Microbacterium sp. zg-B185]